MGVDYLQAQYGDEAVREYLRRFANSFYAPLKEQLASRGLGAMKDHFAKVYEVEGGDVIFELSDDELLIEVRQCPAVAHMRSRGYSVARMWVETTRTVNEALCEGTDFAAELLSYDEQTGASVQRFSRRKP